MKETKKRTVFAHIKSKNIIVDTKLHDVSLAKGVPMNDTDYEVTFETVDKELITFVTNPIWYPLLIVGAEGDLTYNEHKHYNELISFADIIKGDIAEA